MSGAADLRICFTNKLVSMAWLNNETSHLTIAYHGNWHPQVTGVQHPMRTYGTCSNHKGYVRRYVRTRAGVQGGPPFCIALHGGEGHTTRPLTVKISLLKSPLCLGPPSPQAIMAGVLIPTDPPELRAHVRTWQKAAATATDLTTYGRTYVRTCAHATDYVRTYGQRLADRLRRLFCGRSSKMRRYVRIRT